MEWNGTQITQITQIEIKNYGYMLYSMAPKSPKGDFGECRGGGIKFMRSYAFRTLRCLVLNKKKRPSGKFMPMVVSI